MVRGWITALQQHSSRTGIRGRREDSWPSAPPGSRFEGAEARKQRAPLRRTGDTFSSPTPRTRKAGAEKHPRGQDSAIRKIICGLQAPDHAARKTS